MYKTRSALYLVPTNLFVASSQINCIVHDLDFILILGVRSRKPKINGDDPCCRCNVAGDLVKGVGCERVEVGYIAEAVSDNETVLYYCK